MTTGSRIFRNFAALSVGQVVSMTCSLIVAVILARVLGPASYGILGFGAALLSYLGLVVNMGLDVHGVRVISHDPEQTGALVGFVLIFRVIISAALFAILLGGLDYINQPEMVKIVVLIQGCGLFFVALNLDFVFQAMQQMKVMAARQIAASLMALIAVFILITSPADLYKAAGIPAAVNMVTAVVVLIIFLNSSGVRIEIRRGFSMARDLLKSSVPVALMAALNTIYVSLDIVILQFMRPQDEVGLYVVASRVLALAVVPAGILHSVFLPALSSVFDDDERRYGIAR
ncbi:MAG: oligosaccharide flippase family protein, partial [Rhodospirillaceae bacterium]|nr:oligosaccharide flippase family protein [Rhodospirillaceae bacterium]